MRSLILPAGYKSILSVEQTEDAIKQIKDFFQTHLAFKLRLRRVTAPILVASGTGLNDDLCGEPPLRFQARNMGQLDVEIVQSLAKWKRWALAAYDYHYPLGIYTDMNAIRPEERADNLHSLYVDQWDWEKIMKPAERTLTYLKTIVTEIYSVLRDTERYIAYQYPQIVPILPQKITFVHAEELLERYPGLSPAQREDRICREKGAVFVIGIGHALSDGRPHDGRAPDYDDWSTATTDNTRGLNGDILVWYPLLDKAMELSSMGIRVNQDSLAYQLKVCDKQERLDLFFHQQLLAGKLPQTIGGGIGQSRVCQFCLRKAHIGEIQAGIWPQAMREACKDHAIFLL